MGIFNKIFGKEPTGSEKSPVSSYNNVYSEYDFVNYVQFIDVQEILARHAVSTLLGKGVKVWSQNDQIDKALNDFVNDNKLHLFLQTLAKFNSKYGRSIVLISRDITGKVKLDIADPMKVNRKGVFHFGEEGEQIILYKWIQVDNNKVRVQETYDKEKVTYSYHFNSSKKEGQEKWDKNVLEQGQRRNGESYYVNERELKDSNMWDERTNKPTLEEVWFHNLGVLPIVEFINLPYAYFYTLSLPDTGMFPWLLATDDYPVKDLPRMINLIYKQMLTEIIINKTRVFGSFDQKDKINIANSSQMKLFVSDFLIEAPMTAEGKKSVEVITSAPKVQEYINAIEHTISAYFNGSAYSWNVSGGDAEIAKGTATGANFIKGKDTETTDTKRQLLTTSLYELMDKVLTILGFMSENAKRDYVIEVMENNSSNNPALVENTIAQVNAKLMSHSEAIAKLRGIPMNEAEEVLENIEEEFNKIIEMTSKEMEAQGENTEQHDKNTDNTDTIDK
jgi:hypothetical protein